MVEAALAAPAGGTEILIVGEAAGFGGRLMRTVCFLDSCEPPAAGVVVSSGIVQKIQKATNSMEAPPPCQTLKLDPEHPR